MDRAIEQGIGIVIALALATIAIWIGVLFLLGYELFLYYRRQQMVKEGRQVFKAMLEEEGMTVEVDNALSAAMAGGMRFSSEQEKVEFPGL